MYRYILFLLIILFCSESCSNNTLPKEGMIRYKADLELYPNFLVDHFPKEIKKKPIIVDINNDTTNMCISFSLTKYYDQENDLLSFPIKVSYHATDSNLVVIKRSLLLRKSRKRYSKEDLNNNYPIPYFEFKDYSDFRNAFSQETKSGLSKDFKINIIDSNVGGYWDGLKPLSYMPEGWKNGYSKGISINEKANIIIYWVIIW